MLAFCLATLGSLLLSGCGRLLDPPTPSPRAEAAAMPSDTPAPTTTRSATLTPVPATPSNTPTPTTTPTPIIYAIKKGDTLLAIAREFGVTVRDIQDVNGIDDPRRLWIGQEILIPPRAPGSEPTIAPTPTPVALRVLGLGFYRTPADSLWCLGEVLNLSNEPAEEVQVEVTLHDAQGQRLAAGAAFIQLDILAQGGRAPFGILFSAPPASFSQYQAKVLSGVRSTHLGPRYTSLAVAEDWGGFVDGHNYQVRGRVENTGQVEAEKVAVVVTLYDGESHVVGARTVSVEAEVFLPGAVAPFDVTLTPLGPVDHHSVEIQGWRVGYPTPEETARP